MIILGSQSPRRIELLKEITRDFITMKPLFNEETINKNTPHYTLKEAKNKAISLKNLAKPEDFLICCDTSVIYEDIIFGKPKDINNAKEILRFLSNKTHKVITAFVIMHGETTIEKEVITYVTFNELSDSLINKYVTECDVLDKAGSYGIQYDENYHIIKKIDGSLSNVIGFPIDEIRESLILLGAI